MGMALRLPLLSYPTWEGIQRDIIDKYNINNVFLADVHESAKSVYETNLRESLILVIGSESTGVSLEV
jgi:tRNA G18 (ribose-2'-O)-methylase SpoU